MIIRDIDKHKSIYEKVDALLIVNKDNTILYSAMINDDRTYIATKRASEKTFLMFTQILQKKTARMLE